MISRCLDGPAADRTFDTRRAPMYLRVVHDQTGDKWDVLNELGDEPAAAEAVHVYEAVPETWSFGFVRPGGRFEGADYRHRSDVNGEALRDAGPWRRWAEAQPPIKMVSDALRKTLDDLAAKAG